MNMKQLILIITTIITFTLNVNAASVFVNKNGNYTKVSKQEWKTGSLLKNYVFEEDTIEPGAPVYYAYRLGYKYGETYSHHFTDNNNIIIVFLKSFTKDVIYVYMSEDKDELTEYDMMKYMKKFNFYSNFSISYAIKNGVSKAFVMKFPGIKVNGNKIIDSKNGFIYTTNGNMITNAVYIDGFNEYAKEYQGRPIFDKIEQNAMMKHYSKQDIIREINFQFECLMKIPTDMIELATNGSFNFNFAELYFVLKETGDLSDFKLCVPDANLTSQWNNIKVYEFRRAKYYFKNNKLFKVELPS